MRVPLADLRAQTAAVQEEVERRIASVLENASFILGPGVAEFEQAYAGFLSVKHYIGAWRTNRRHRAAAPRAAARTQLD